MNADPNDFWYIQLSDYDSKFPSSKWGGYSQSFVASDDVYTHGQVAESDWDHWGIVGTTRTQDHATLTTLVFDLDVHKAADPDAVAEQMSIPSDTMMVKSQSGGFHVYYFVHADRGALGESDFEMVGDHDWDIDIRGSSVSMHVVAPSDIPGVDTPYEVVQDEAVKTVLDPADAAERIQFDGEPLLEYNPGRSYSGGVEIDRDVEPPAEMPTCYHRGLQLRAANPDEHPNTHKVNVLTALCGLAAGYDVETMVDHFCDEYAPAGNADRERTEYQLGHLAEHVERGEYSPPAVSTLRDFGILDDGETCECDIAYHGDDDSPTLDVVDDRSPDPSEAEAVAGEAGTPAETDGGTAATTETRTRRSFADRVIDAIGEFNDDIIQLKTARDRIATAFCEHYDFVAPEREVNGWRDTLYVFNDDEGIYEPRGEAFIEAKLEQAAGDFTTNQVTNEIAEKVRRRSIARGDQFDVDPHRLVVGNGILDLHTGECEPYSPSEYHRTKIDVDWNPDAGEPEAIDDFLHDIVGDDDVATLYRLIAHSLYKEYVGEKAAMLIGSGQNGKSVFLDFVEQFLGGPNVSHRSLQAFEDDFKANQLEGKLANIHPDMGDHAVKDLSTFKKLTGRDSMLADVKYEAPIEFENYATLLFAANEMPAFSEDNHAVWRRWVYVDFPHTFDGNDPDAKDPEPKRTIMRRLTTDEELEALLVRCQREIQEWYAGREWYADAMEPDEVREKMKKASEPVFAFASTCLEPSTDEEAFIEKNRVRECYNAFADAEDLPRIPENEFGERLVGLRDFQIESSQRRVDGGRPRVYENVQFTSRGRQLLGVDDPDDGQAQVGDADDRMESAKPIVMERVREMFEENGCEPIPEEGVVWGCTSDMGKGSAEHALEELKRQGDVQVIGDAVAPTN